MACFVSAQDPALREKAVGVLRGGIAASVPEEFWPAMHAAEGLSFAGYGAEVRRALEPRLATEDDPRRRCGLARELFRAGDRSKVAILAGVLADDDARGHTHAAESLFKVGEIGDAAALERAFAQRNTLGLRLMAAAALARHGRTDAVAAVREALCGTDPDGIRLAAWILGQIGEAADIEPLRRRLADVSVPLVRAYVEHALAQLGDSEGIAALGRNLASADPDIRAAAANFAGESRAFTAAPQLVRLLDDPVADVRIRAAHSILLLDRPAEKADRRP